MAESENGQKPKKISVGFMVAVFCEVEIPAETLIEGIAIASEMKFADIFDFKDRQASALNDVSIKVHGAWDSDVTAGL